MIAGVIWLVMFEVSELKNEARIAVGARDRLTTE